MQRIPVHWLIGATVALFVFLVLATSAELWSRGTLAQARPVAPATSIPQRPAPTATPAPREGRISLTVANEYALSPDRATFETLSRATRDNDMATIRRIASAGGVTLVPNGTRVRVLQTDMNLIRVEVTDGPHRGRSGWLPVNLVGP